MRTMARKITETQNAIMPPDSGSLKGHITSTDTTSNAPYTIVVGVHPWRLLGLARLLFGRS